MTKPEAYVMRGELTGLQALAQNLEQHESDLEREAVEQEIAYATSGGGSGRGMSYYREAARCGRKARLLEERRIEAFEQGRIALSGDKHALAIGSIYHLMHEQARAPREGKLIDFKKALANVNVAEAYRMFAGWKATFGLGYWGRCLSVEQKCVVHIDDLEISGAFDMVVELTAQDAERVASRFADDAAKPSAGRYIIDWKTADGESNGIAYQLGVQALWYPALYNLLHEDKVQGMIFDVAMKRGRRRDRGMYASDFAAHYVPFAPGHEATALAQIRPMARQGRLNVINDVPNRAECVDWMGKVCTFFNNGCDQ